MLYGEYSHNLDAKGRVTVPAKFREDLGDCFYICKGTDECIFVLSEEAYKTMMEKIVALPAEKSIPLTRKFSSGTCDVEPDKQGRILIPQNLRDYAGLTKEVTIIGSVNRAEIWDSAKWKAYNDALTDEVTQEALKEVVL